LNFFGIPFGLAGLGGIWFVAAEKRLVPSLVGDALLALAALVWLVVLAAYLRYVRSERGAFQADLLDPVAGPFASLAVIVPMPLAELGIAPHAPVTGRVLVDAFIALTALAGAWFTGQWIYGGLELDRFHPGYYLPTVTGGLIASNAAAAVGQPRLAEVMLGYGTICWIVLGSLILGRLLFRPFLPTPLVPTLAIEAAPAALASIAYLEISGGRVDAFAAFLAGYGLLMVVAQVRLLPAFARLSFAPSFWAFAFSWATVGTATMLWIDALGSHPAYAYLVLAAVTMLIATIAARTVVALSRRELLPTSGPANPTTPAGGSLG
jgi:tellurite resistance protein